jgi:hypothetical protein
MAAQLSHWLPHGFVYSCIDIPHVGTTNWQILKRLSRVILTLAAILNSK